MPDIAHEVTYKTARSGGSGGQNVNKVETQVEAIWDVAASPLYTDEEKALIQTKLQNRLNKDGYVAVKCNATRSQLENKEMALKKLTDLVARSLIQQKPRKATKPTREAKEKRLETKKKEAQKKEGRKKPPRE